MSAKLIFSLYSQNSGMEITPAIKVNGTKGTSEGRVQLRFFLLKAPGEGGKTTQIKFVLEPFEAFDLFLRMHKVHSEGGKEKIVHKFVTGTTETITNLTVEKWERGGKSGLGFAVGRGEAFISVPVNKDSISRFLFAAEFLRSMSVRQSWVDRDPS
ncbi:MAG: hypothetical protein WC007_14510 [Pelobacteraceae bacterium]